MEKDYFSQKSPALSLHRSMFILQQRADEMLAAKTGVGLSQIRIMSQLHFSVARSQRTVAIMLHQTEANISRQLQTMKKQGLVSVSRNKKDRRLREVTLTDKGRKVYQKAEKLLDAQYDNLQKQLGKSEAKSFKKSLDFFTRSI